MKNGDVDSDFIKNHTEGFEKYRESVMQRTTEESADICGVSVDDLRQAAAHIGNAKGFLTLWTMGLNQSVVGVNKNLSLINLNLITGHIGKPGSGPFSLTGQPNAMGGREVGGLSNLLPAHRDLLNPAHRAEVQKFWGGTEISPKPGLTATEMFEALNEGKLKAIWIICTNPLISLPDVRMAEAALRKAKFVVVQDIAHRVETLKYADVVFPAAAWTEKEGTMTNAERRISYLSKVTDAPGEALPDAEIICRFGQKMGFSGFDYKNAEEIYLEHCQLTRGTNIDISGLNYSILKEQTVQWGGPLPASPQGGGEKDGSENSIFSETKSPLLGRGLGEAGRGLFRDRKFFTSSQKAIIHTVPDSNTSEQPDEDFPLILTTGRIRDQWHTRSKTGKVNKLNQHIAEAFLEIHPDDAKSRGIEEDQLTEVFTRRGQVRVKARLSQDIKRGVVFLPMHWGKVLNSDLNRANNLTNNLIDPKSKEPDFKFCAVQVQKYRKPKQKIVVVGAGAGAFGFVKSYRALNADDEITIFSKENFPFYNRVMLPDYISGHQTWEQLVKMKDEEEDGYRIRLHRGVSIETIDRTNKKVLDSQGVWHEYDILLLATGSRAAMLRDVPPLKGIFTMRSRYDADNFKELLNGPLPASPQGGGEKDGSENSIFSETESPLLGRGLGEAGGREGASVVIVGGGLLGIELAASLREIDFPVTVIQRISRLMDRQLDPLGSQLLHEELTDKGIEIFYNDEIETFIGKDTIEGIRLKSGQKIACGALVIAIGTTPNSELAKAADLTCKRGVVVNEYLQTSDPNIYAIGEIAEFQGFLYGITAAAEQQADIVARYLNGDIAAYYQGSLLMNILKVQGTDICSLGLAEAPPDNPAYEEVLFMDKAKRYYKKCIIHNDRLVGAILIGDKSEFAEFRDLIGKKMELSEKRLQLLRSNQKAEPMLGKLVCSCGGVGEGNIVNKIKEGCTELKPLCQASGAGLGCGSCRPEVQAILEREMAKVEVGV